jgi:diguanylate cyclase (GGDEF)-like protein
MKRTINYDYIKLSAGALVIILAFLLAYIPRPPETPAESGIRNLAVLEDKSGLLTYAEVQERDRPFRAQPTSRMFEKHSASAFWMRFTISPSHLGPNFYLETEAGNLENFVVYFPDHPPVFSGKKIPAREVPVKARIWYTPIPDNLSESKPVYIRLQSNTILRIPLRVIPGTRVISKVSGEFFFFGIFFGAIIAVFFINLFSYAVVKNRIFLFYVLYLLSLLAYHFRVHGFLYYFGLPFSVYEAILWLSLAGLGIFMILFAQAFLGLPARYPRIHLILNVFIGLFLVQTLLGVAGNSLAANKIAYVTGMIVPIIIIATTAYDYFRGNREARYYLLAWCALFAGTLIWSLTAYVDSFVPTSYIFVVGSTIDSLLFTLAIFDLIKRELREKEMLVAREQYYIELASTDPLTNLYNRRFLEEEVRRIDQDQEPFTQNSMIMIDLDNFREVNERFGHMAGDAILIRISEAIQKRIKKSDIACRYGGDEFLLLLYNTLLPGARDIAEQVRQDIARMDLASETGEKFTITASIGVSECRAEDSFEGLFLRADHALLKAKRSGRNSIASL